MSPSPKSAGEKTLLVTGSCGLIGSEVVTYFSGLDWNVVGLDNNMRREFFGPKGDIEWNRQRLEEACPRYRHRNVDIRHRKDLEDAVQETQPDLVVHTAAQPSHDLAASRPFDDFDVNAVGTLNLLEAVRRHKSDAVFVHLSTNKVYGDRPNSLPLEEFPTRWDYADEADFHGIPETFSIDHSKHSLFGASKAAADLMVQEYGRYFDMATCCLRGGCLTGPNHSGVELHGFLSYLVRCNLEQREYTIFGYQGKQVRDNIHAHDVAQAIEAFFERPSPAAVFNLGGGRANSVSILEAFDRVQQLTGIPMRSTYSDQARSGDHICYISDLRHIQRELPGWRLERSLEDIFEELVAGWHGRLEETS